MHPRNRFREGYDFEVLVRESRSLAPFVRPNAHGDLSVDYANPEAVKALNRALLKHAYGIEFWDIPPGSLCPPIPGRSDYVHHVADLIGGRGRPSPPGGPGIQVLDIGTGANCIYPLIGASEYGFRFVGTETDPDALRAATRIVEANASVAKLIECRRQTEPLACFRGVIRTGEFFHASMCNPPFHASAAEAAAGNLRKRINLGTRRPGATRLNFGGRAAELWCPGGELGFVLRMIEESRGFRDQCLWFTTLVSKSAHLPRLQAALRRAQASEVRTIEMAQGQKRSRILAWTFTAAQERATVSGTRGR